MTLPLRKKRQTTARRSIKLAIADRSRGSRRRLSSLIIRWGICIPAGVLGFAGLGLEPLAALAQNPLRTSSSAGANAASTPPAWSPAPFQANPLRDITSAARPFESDASPNSSAEPKSTRVEPAIATKPMRAATQADHATAVTKASEVLRWRKVELPNVVAKQSAAPEVTTAAFQDPAGRQPPRSSLLVQPPSEPSPKALPEPTPSPLVAQPPALSLPPAVAPEPQQQPSLRLPPVTQPPAVQEPAIQVPSPMPESVLPNPFPKPPALDRKLRDPANLTEPDKLQPGTKPDDEDLPPVPPKRAEQSVANCDLVRDFAAGADIRNFELDSSPDFVQGYQSANRPGSLTKETFVTKSPVRTWRGTQGEYVAEGKLVDLVYGTVIIEQSDGKRVSYLQRMLSDADQVFVSEAWGIPVTCPLGDQGFAARLFADSTFTWKASGACNKPLYFEDVALERYGHEWGPVVQPVVSTVRFFGDLAILPYKMGIHPPNECQHPLGYYRPGSCAPWSLKPVPLSLRGAATQAAFVTGTVFTLP